MKENFTFGSTLKLLLCLVILVLEPCIGSAQNEKPKKEKVKTFHENGKIKEQGKLLNGQKEGIWLTFHPSGYMLTREKYKNNLLQWAIYYNEKHQKVKLINKDGSETPYKGCNCKN